MTSKKFDPDTYDLEDEENSKHGAALAAAHDYLAESGDEYVEYEVDTVAKQIKTCIRMNNWRRAYRHQTGDTTYDTLAISSVKDSHPPIVRIRAKRLTSMPDSLTMVKKSGERTEINLVGEVDD